MDLKEKVNSNDKPRLSKRIQNFDLCCPSLSSTAAEDFRILNWRSQESGDNLDSNLCEVAAINRIADVALA